MELNSEEAARQLIKAESCCQTFSGYYNTLLYATPAYESYLTPSFINICSSGDKKTDFQNEFSNSECRIYFACLPKSESSIRKDLLHYADITGNMAPGNQLLDSFPLIFEEADIGTGEPSLAESLLCERKRADFTCFSDVCVASHSGLIVMLSKGQAFYAFDHTWKPSKTTKEELVKNETPIKPTMLPLENVIQSSICPSNPYLIAFVSNIDVITVSIDPVSHMPSIPHNLTNLPPKSSVSAGTPSFVIQEEFNRYDGIWWCPHQQVSTDGNNIYKILYEETDESNVSITYLQRHDGWSQQLEMHRYPKPGQLNATSTLKIVQFAIGSDYNVKDVRKLELPFPLLQLFCGMEYIVRAGWTKHGEYVWVQFANRVQSKLSLVLIPLDNFIDTQDVRQIYNWNPCIQLVQEENPDTWVEVDDCLHFLDCEKLDKMTTACKLQFIWASSQTGYRHLYYLVRQWNPYAHLQKQSRKEMPSIICIIADIVSSRQLSFGEWEVLPKQIYVDNEKQFILFEGLKEHPLWSNVYAVSYSTSAPSGLVYRLTVGIPHSQLQAESLSIDNAALSHSIATFHASSGLIVVRSSNHTHLLGYQVCKLQWEPLESKISCVRLTWLLKHCLVANALPRQLNHLVPPKVLTMQFEQAMTKKAVTCYGILFTPITEKPLSGFPTLHLVYGGPGVQLVQGKYSKLLFLQAQVYCHYGYAVLLCDCRGSTNRGVEFSGCSKYKLGVNELDDHVAFLQQTAYQTGLIDLNRVAIQGSSYGGYMALMAAARYKHIYKAAIAGSPVVDWRHYDTAYTERYLGIPAEHPDAYTLSSVLTYVSLFPDTSPYLLISHGGQDENVHFSHTSALLQQLDSLGKPYSLLYYPASRHNIREKNHLLASILCHLDKTLKGINAISTLNER